jgi:redox-sensitive bicupin YhaK (pirin superfamily)
MISTIQPLEKDIGFKVRRLLPSRLVRCIGPFVFFDHMGPATFEPETCAGDVRPHPHIGLATVTYLFSGAMMHRDSLGIEKRIEPEAINLMTAGHGVTHSERIPDDIRKAGSVLEGIQTWLALPPDQVEHSPHFEHYPTEKLPMVELVCASARVLIGHAFGVTSPVKTASPTLYVDLQLEAGARLTLARQTAVEHGLYLAQGDVHIQMDESAEPLAIETHQMVCLQRQGQPLSDDVIISSTQGARLMWFGGDALPEQPRLNWNFVAYSQQRIEQAREDWANDLFEPVPNEHERIPLPD